MKSAMKASKWMVKEGIYIHYMASMNTNAPKINNKTHSRAGWEIKHVQIKKYLSCQGEACRQNTDGKPISAVSQTLIKKP